MTTTARYKTRGSTYHYAQGLIAACAVVRIVDRTHAKGGPYTRSLQSQTLFDQTLDVIRTITTGSDDARIDLIKNEITRLVFLMSEIKLAESAS